MHWAQLRGLLIAVERPHTFLVSLLLAAAQPALGQVPDQLKIDAAAREFMEHTSSPGLAIGIVTPDGARVFSYGAASATSGAPVDERTLFEVGSISKTVTVALAAYAAETGALEWDEPPGRYVPELKGNHLDDVSLLNLATHTTGGMPLQLPDGVSTNAELMTYFQSWKPKSPPGSVRTYANPSIGLLGVVTARALKGDFAALVRDKIFASLGLHHSSYEVPQAEQRNYAQGYTRDGKPVRMASAQLSAEAYGLRTTARDLLRFIEAQLGLVDTSPALRRAFAATQIGHFRAGPLTQALIWEWYPLPVSENDVAVGNGDSMVLKANPVTRLNPPLPPPANALINKTGATNGFGAYAAFIPGLKIGLVLLANRNHPTTVRLALAKQVFMALGVQGMIGR